VAVALVGAIVSAENGDEMAIKKTTISGSISEGMLCDSHMLGWSGGASGIAAQIPVDVAIGSIPPKTKPRLIDDRDSTAIATSSPAPGLFERKLTKEEKKKLAEERKIARKAAKQAVQNTEADME
jgi:tRNA-binding EMAP/Myf-like protein